MLHEIKRGIKADIALPNRVRRYSKDIDAALSGKHTKVIYDALNKDEAGVLV